MDSCRIEGLKENLGFPLLAISVGGIIGSAWLFAPLCAAQLAGPSAIFSWLISGEVALLLALVYSELGASFPVAGGLARLSFFSHGNLAGFVAGFACWLGYVAIAPIEVQAMIRYLADSQTWRLQQDGTQTLTLAGMAVAAVLLFGMSFINLLGVQWFGECNKWITLWKILIPVSIPVAPMFTGTPARLTFAMSENPQLPGFFRLLNKRGVPALCFVAARKIFSSKEPLDLARVWWVIPYGAGLLAISFFGNFGEGRAVLPHGWDLLVVGAFSILIYFISMRCGTPRLPESSGLRIPA